MVFVEPGTFGAEPFQPVPNTNPNPPVLILKDEIKKEILPIETPGKRIPSVETVLAELLLKAKREATDWKPYTFTLSGGTDQIVGRKPGRKTLALFNGQANVNISNTQNGLNVNEYITLDAGASLSLDCEGPVWAKGTAGETVQYIETFYDLDAIAIAKLRIQEKFNDSPNVNKSSGKLPDSK